MKTNNEIITSYKGFDKDLKCRGFQYEVGKEYVMDEPISICNKGFHACESPLEVFDYYGMLDSRFCRVEQCGEIQRDNNTTKICSSKIKLKAELKLSDMINIGVEWLKEITDPKKINTDYKYEDGSSGDHAQIGSSGNFAQIGSSGYYAQINSTGYDSVIMCAGLNSKAKAKKGSWITLAEWEYSDEKERNIPVCVKTEYVDGYRIKEDTWYILKNGEFIEYVCS